MISLELVLKTLCELYRVSILTCVYVADAPNFGANVKQFFSLIGFSLAKKFFDFLFFTLKQLFLPTKFENI